jgi:hypothetical protein
MSKELANKETADIVQYTGDNLLALAIEKGADVDSLSKLMDLQERQMNKAAEQDYNRAITGFQSELRPISKNRKSYVGEYATLDHIAKSIAPLLTKYELSYSFESDIDDGMVKVTCKINHINGHSQTARFTAPIDPSAKVNDMQKTASALSYARRYALQLALGITTTDEDDDGESGGVQAITADQVTVLTDLIEEVGADKAGYLKFLKVNSLEEIPAHKYERAVSALEAKR